MTGREYRIAEGFEKISSAYERYFSRGFGWMANVSESEAIPRAIALRERGYDVESCRPTYNADGSESEKVAILVKRNK